MPLSTPVGYSRERNVRGYTRQERGDSESLSLGPMDPEGRCKDCPAKGPGCPSCRYGGIREFLPQEY